MLLVGATEPKEDTWPISHGKPEPEGEKFAAE